MMRGMFLAWAALALVGCDRSATTSEMEGMVYAQAATIDTLRNRVSALEDKNREQDEAIQGVRALGLENAGNHDSLRKTFNQNVDQNNNAKVANMTTRGACGQEWVDYPDGGRALRNKECTLKDLK